MFFWRTQIPAHARQIKELHWRSKMMNSPKKVVDGPSE